MTDIIFAGSMGFILGVPVGVLLMCNKKLNMCEGCVADLLKKMDS